MTNKTNILNSNALKIIALISMTIDHIGRFLFPDMVIFRIIGRIAFPIFAFFIAQGCKYSRHKIKYFFLIFVLGLSCQLLISSAINFMHFNILLTFSLSILLIYLYSFMISSYKNHNKYKIILSTSLFVVYIAMLVVLFFPFIHLSPFTVDYGFFGILLPLLAYISDNKYIRLSLFTVGLILISIFNGATQWCSLLATIPLFFYSGERGKINLKYLFYIYYPLHLIVLLLIKNVP